jgi:hypothetical protein
LVDVAHEVVVREFDCKTTRGILVSSLRQGGEIIVSLADRISGRILNKDIIIHYHCWVNSRYRYNENMSKIESLKLK